MVDRGACPGTKGARTVSATVQGGRPALSVEPAATSVRQTIYYYYKLLGKPVNKHAALCAISGLSERRGPVEY